MELSPQQGEALDGVNAWFGNQHLRSLVPQVFRLFGYAGTGKTTIARAIADGKGDVLFAAYTGKAAQVLASKGCPATTLHSLIYLPNGEKVELEMEQEPDGSVKLDDDGRPVPKRDEHGKVIPKPGGKRSPRFVLDPYSPLFEADLLIVDEVSMVGRELGEDIMSFKKPILVLGDPAQLPPVEGGGYFTKQEPDILLREIHRQAEGSRVLKIATDIRQRRPFPRLGKVSYQTATEFDQVIVGTNSMRWRMNETIRELKRFPVGKPVPGDKIIVLQNNREHGVMNGQTYGVLSYHEMSGVAEVLDDEGNEREMLLWQQGFTETGEKWLKELPFFKQRQRVVATFGWAITCHKSQGSQWGTVLVVDEANVFRNNATRWMYTAVTRAVDEVYIAAPDAFYHKLKVRPRLRRAANG